MTVADSVPVARGNLGTALTVATPAGTLAMRAGRGKLVMQYDDPETVGFRFHVKNSGDTGNFSWTYKTSTIVITSGNVFDIWDSQVTPTGFWWYTRYTVSSPNQVQLNFFDFTNGTTTSYLTGIRFDTGSPAVYKPFAYNISSSGHHLFTCIRDDAGTPRLALASFNLTTTVYLYTDTIRAVNGYDQMGVPFETSANQIRFSASESGPGAIGNINGAYHYEVALT